MIFRDQPLFGFDCETTSVDPETASIVTACVGWAHPTARTWSPVNWLLKQDQPIPDEATQIHGITTDQANTEGMDHTLALTEIRDAIAMYWANGWPMCGHNLSYDLTLLDRELRRHQLGSLTVTGVVLDTYVITKQLDVEAHSFVKGRRYTLTAVAERFGVPLGDDAHGAEPDTHAATRLAWKLAPQLPPDVMTWQADAYREQRLSFARWQRRQGDEAAAVETEKHTDWPVWTGTTTTERAA